MKKDRNTFFSNYNAQSQSFIPNISQMQNIQPMQNMQMPNNQFGPYQAANQSSSFYAGPDIASSNDIDNRLSKIERQINRLDSRITRLENNTTALDNNDSQNYNNMYML